MENKNTQANGKNNEHASSSLERNELHNTIWKVANELRGSVDGWDFKQYVLGILFYRYIKNGTLFISNSSLIKTRIIRLKRERSKKIRFLISR
nr:type I restriction-modification system subunit M N-terminal domain-containing protein [Helicobacter pylori]